MLNVRATQCEKRTTPLGIIEGFFGREWSWEDRVSYADFLARYRFDFYIYAPKSDSHLRKQWRHDWPQSQKKHLQSLREHFGEKKINFGIGLSPYEIHMESPSSQRKYLAKRTQQINELSPDILCILFDDMRGDIPGLAQLQIDIAHQAAAESNAKKIIFCPTYYSFDPVLQKVFGTMPGNYWSTFATNLDTNIDIFWTGEKVCSSQYPEYHLAEVKDILGRAPFIWDNYPVNDGAAKSQFLHLRPVDKMHSALDGKIAGHAVNPMNQAWLSRIPLASVLEAYNLKTAYDPSTIFPQIFSSVCGEEFGNALISDIAKFQDQGLKNLSEDDKKIMRNKYQHFAENPFAQEVIAWLNNEYEFDPACLTD